jgi:hypothetical protein
MPDNARRLRLVAPAAFCALSAVALGVASFAAYGAADSVDYPGWGPTAGGLLLALPLLAVSLRALNAMWRETVTDYNVNGTKLLLGSAAFLLAAALLIAYAVTAGRSASYEGEFNAITGRYDPLFNLNSFLIASLIASAMIAVALHAASEKLYVASIDHQRDSVEGPDPLGALMQQGL